MIKICYVIGQLGKGGAEKQLYEIVKGINKNNFEPVIISLSRGGYWSKEIKKLNIHVIELRRKKHIELTRLFKLIKLVRKIKPAIVHTYLFSANSYGRIAAILDRVPIIIASERNLPKLSRDKNIYQISIDKLLMSFSDGVICNSYKCSEILVRKYLFDENKVFTVSNGINSKEYLKKANWGTQKKLAQKVIGTVGRLTPQKNHKLLLDVAKIILDHYGKRDIKFMIVGDGVLRNKLEQYSKNLGIQNSVVFTGERNDVSYLLYNMDIFIMTSLYEGMSNALMEAMLAGLPIVTTNVGGNSELIIEGETGVLCPLNDAKAFADKIIYFIDNETQAKQIGDNAKQRIIKEFGIEKMIKRIENIYTKLLEKLYIQ